MEKRNDLTVVPIERTILSREWLLIIAAFIASAALWIFLGVSSGRNASAQQSGIYNNAPQVKPLEVIFLDVNEGDCAFIRTPHGHTTLIDAGPGKGDYSPFDAGRQVVVPFLKSRHITKLDTLMMTHPHADHYGGMIPVMNAVDVGEFLDPGLQFPSKAYENVLKKVKEKSIPFKVITAPAILDWDKDLLVQVLWPENIPSRRDDPNNNSIVLRIQHGNIIYFFTGDMEAPVERELYAYGHSLDCTILKVPHHGSRTSSSRNLLNLLKPRLAVISVGRHNRFGHPKQEIVDRYRDMKIKILRTDQNGTIKTYSNGERVKVQPEYGAAFSIYPLPPKSPEGV